MYRFRSVCSSVCWLALGPAYFHSNLSSPELLVVEQLCPVSCLAPLWLQPVSKSTPGVEVSSKDGLLWKRGKEDKQMTVLLQAVRKMCRAPTLNMGTREGEWLHGREQTEALCFHSQTSRSDKRRQWTNIGNTDKIMGLLIIYWLQEQENIVNCNYDRQEGHWKQEYPG